MQPAILLVLADETRAHGYELIERVDALVGAEVCVDSGSVYRLLREMESAGLLKSTWQLTERGPNRRIYGLTEQGLLALRAQGEDLRGRAALLEALASEIDKRVSPAARPGSAARPGAGEEELDATV
jgi:DNA-binding PadR family transcriptional regulator